MSDLKIHTGNSARSQLQSIDVNNWLKKRYFNKVKKQYLLLPEQIQQEQEILKIFQNFDRDNSNNLDIAEMYDMFQKYGFKVTEKQLQQFFKVVDKDKDNALNWNEFKNSVFDEDASKIFYNIVTELRQREEQGQAVNKGYIPFQFNDMISYLNYLTSRNELQEQIQQGSLSTFEKFQKFIAMIKLTSTMKICNDKDIEWQQIIEEKKEESIEEQAFTKSHQTKYNHSKNSFYNKNDLPLLIKLKSSKKNRSSQDFKVRTSLDSQQTMLSHQISWQTIAKEKHLNLETNNSNHMILMSNMSLFRENEKLSFSKSAFANNSSQSKLNPYLQLNLNSINRGNNLIQDQTNRLRKNENSEISDHLPTQIFQELNQFKILTGSNKKQQKNKLKKITTKLKKSTSVMKTSTEMNFQSPINSKLQSPRIQRDEKCYTVRRSINRPIFQTFSQYNKQQPVSLQKTLTNTVEKCLKVQQIKLTSL